MKKSILWIIILVVVLIVIWFFTQSNEPTNNLAVNNPTNDAVNDVDVLDDTNDANEVNDGEAQEDDMGVGEEDVDDNEAPAEDANTIVHDGYQLYAEDAVKSALVEGKQVVLFFHAAWCPDCRTLDADLTENEDMIDANTMVFRVDYDSETALKDRYVITDQHTLVYLDENMDAVDTVRGVFTTDEVLANFDN